MKKVFSRNFLSKAPGGDRYEWKEIETAFTISKSGLVAIKIDASAKSAAQNNSNDDDDLRLALDDYEFGKYERHQEMISWKGFGTSSSWDGASQKGGTKTIYFFVNLKAGPHVLRFFADGTPTLKGIEIFEIKDKQFELKHTKPSERIESEKKGIPWISFVFLDTPAKTLSLQTYAKSRKIKQSADGDNLKIVVNGKILQNPYSKTSDKYKNFYFSGDLKESDVLTLPYKELDNPLAFENSIEFWYDEEPEIVSLTIDFFDEKEFLEEVKKFFDLKEYVLFRAHAAIPLLHVMGKKYSAQFLKHSLKPNPSGLVFKFNHPISKKIRSETVYKNILEKLKEKISLGQFEGEIWPEEIPGEIVFALYDLSTALHGIRKIQYKAQAQGAKRFQVEMKLFDVYDFEQQKASILNIGDYAASIAINALDIGENLGLVNNFEIEIQIKENLYATQ